MQTKDDKIHEGNLPTMAGVTFTGSVHIDRMFDIHDNGHVEIHTHHYAAAARSEERIEKSQVPDVLTTPPAQILLRKLQAAGLLDGQFQPVELSATKRGVLAQELAVRLDISNTWQVFSELWSMDSEHLRSAYNKGMDQKNIGEYLGKIKGILN